jgi:hypothetical protein
VFNKKSIDTFVHEILCTLGYTELDWERIQFIMEKMGVQNIILEIQQNHRKWLQHLE